MERRFDGLERTMVDKSELASSAAETRRHFDVVAEGIRADNRLFRDPIGSHTESTVDPGSLDRARERFRQNRFWLRD